MKFILFILIISTANYAQNKRELNVNLHYDPPSKAGMSFDYSYRLMRYIYAESYLSLSNELLTKTERHIKSHYNFRFGNKTGIGIQTGSDFFKCKTAILAGFKSYAFNEEVNNPQLEKINYTSIYTSFDAGILQRIVLGKKKTAITLGIYFPFLPREVYYDYKTFMQADAGIVFHY